MDILYTQIEEGMADEYDLERLKKLKGEMNIIRAKMAELEARPEPYLNRDQVKAVIESYHDAIKTKSADKLRALIDNFINQVTIFKNEIVIEFKVNVFSLDGAPE